MAAYFLYGIGACWYWKMSLSPIPYRSSWPRGFDTFLLSQPADVDNRYRYRSQKIISSIDTRTNNSKFEKVHHNGRWAQEILRLVEYRCRSINWIRRSFRSLRNLRLFWLGSISASFLRNSKNKRIRIAAAYSLHNCPFNPRKAFRKMVCGNDIISRDFVAKL